MTHSGQRFLWVHYGDTNSTSVKQSPKLQAKPIPDGTNKKNSLKKQKQRALLLRKTDSIHGHLTAVYMALSCYQNINFVPAKKLVEIQVSIQQMSHNIRRQATSKRCYFSQQEFNQQCL